MAERILVTGGAGFIGSHLVDALLEEGHDVRILDSLDPQVHGDGARTPPWTVQQVERGVQFVHGDVEDPETVDDALDGVSVVFHEAAAVGVGQSMYRIVDYVRTNCVGTSVLLEGILKRRDSIRKMIVASSMSIYGEGRYLVPSSRERLAPSLRPLDQLSRHGWEMRSGDGEILEALPTDEDKPLRPTSVYAVTKRDQEELFTSVGAAYDIPTVALRYFNAYGPRQSLNNPYTGVAAIFASRLLNDKPPLVFEDGRQSRDFIHVSDIVRANLAALERGGDGSPAVYNVGTGRSLNLLDMVDALRARLGGPEPEITGRFRQGDIRHCFADTTRAREGLGFAARISFEEGIEDLAAWARGQTPEDRVDRARQELERAGLTV